MVVAHLVSLSIRSSPVDVINTWFV